MASISIDLDAVATLAGQVGNVATRVERCRLRVARALAVDADVLSRANIGSRIREDVSLLSRSETRLLALRATISSSVSRYGQAEAALTQGATGTTDTDAPGRGGTPGPWDWLGNDRAERALLDLSTVIPYWCNLESGFVFGNDLVAGNYSALIGDGVSIAVGLAKDFPVVGAVLAVTDAAMELAGYPTVEWGITEAFTHPAEFGDGFVTGMGIIGHEVSADFSVGLGIVGNNIQSGCNSIADFFGW